MIIRSLLWKDGKLVLTLEKEGTFELNPDSCEIESQDVSDKIDSEKVSSFLYGLQEYCLEHPCSEEEYNSLFRNTLVGRSLEEYDDPLGLINELCQEEETSSSEEDEDVWEDSWEKSAPHYASSDMAEK